MAVKNGHSTKSTHKSCNYVYIILIINYAQPEILALYATPLFEKLAPIVVTLINVKITCLILLFYCRFLSLNIVIFFVFVITVLLIMITTATKTTTTALAWSPRPPRIIVNDNDDNGDIFFIAICVVLLIHDNHHHRVYYHRRSKFALVSQARTTTTWN